jgi:hypothetical protein
MSRTNRRVPLDHQHIRHPHIHSERRQLSGLQNDRPFLDYIISPLNRIGRHFQIDFEDLTSSSTHELHHG